MSELVDQYLSLGAGVQSSTAALMAAAGEITPMPKAAFFADTQVEPKSVYVWLDWLEKQLPFPVIRATYGDLAKDNLRLIRGRKSGKLYSKSLIPAFIKKPNGTRGILPRKCTRDYKIHVIQRSLKKLLGIKRVVADWDVRAIQWIGISFDELDRQKKSDASWVEHRWPLIELGMTREDYIEWMQTHGYPKPPRSACVFCPYHSDVEWLRLKNDEPDEFKRAVEWEKQYTQIVGLDEVTDGIPFLHDSLVPLDMVEFNPERGKLDKFRNECVGMCGV